MQPWPQSILEHFITSKRNFTPLNCHFPNVPTYPHSPRQPVINFCLCCCCCSVTKSYPTLWSHGLQHARLPCPSLSPEVWSNSCPLSWWCCLTISSSASLSSFCLQSFPASGSFPMSQLFAKEMVAKVLELQHQSFQWIFRVDFL